MPRLIQVEGRLLEFPDETPDEVISDVIKREFASPPLMDVLSYGTRKGISSLQRQAGGAVEFAGDITRSKALVEAGKGIKESADINEEFAKPPGTMSWGQDILAGATGSAISALPYVAGGVVGGGLRATKGLGEGLTLAESLGLGTQVAGRIGLVPMATGAGAERYGELRKEGFSIPRSMLHAGVEAGAEYIGEKAPLGYLGKALGSNAGLTKILSGWFGRELGGEEVTSIIEFFNAKFSDRPEAGVREFAQTLVDTAATTALLGPIQGAVIAPIHYATNRVVRRALEQQVIDEIKRGAPDLKEGTVTPAEPPPITPESDEDIFADLINEVTPERQAAAELAAAQPTAESPAIPEVARMQEEGVEPASLEDKLRAALEKSGQAVDENGVPITSPGVATPTPTEQHGVVRLSSWIDSTGRERAAEDLNSNETISINLQEGSLELDVDRGSAFLGRADGKYVWRTEDGVYYSYDPQVQVLRELMEKPARIGPAITTLQQAPAEEPIDLLTQSASEAIDAATAQQDARPDTALSMKAVGNLLDNYPQNANNETSLGKLPVAWSNGYEGPIRLPNMKPGDVIVAGTSNEMFPPALTEAYGKLYDYLNRRFMGGKGKFIVVLRSPKTKGIVNTSWHTKQGDVHIIQPPHGLALGLRAGEGQPSEEYNIFRKAQIALGAYHEFAHALVYDAIYSFIPQRVMQFLEQESNNWEAIPQRYLDAIPNPLIRAMVKEYSDLKTALSTASGLDFFQLYMSPAKLNNAWLSKYGLGAKTYPEAISYLESRTAKEVVAVMEAKSRGKMQILSFPEYVGEQMARWAYGGTSKLAQAQRASGVGSTAFGRHFAAIWNTMKKLMQEVFLAAKRDRVIKPGVGFQEWLESLTKAPAITDKEIVGTGEGLPAVEEDIARVATERVAEKKAKETKAKEIKDSALFGFTEKDLRAALRGAGIKPSEPEYSEIIKLFQDGDTSGAITMFKEVTGKPFRYDSPEAKAELTRIIEELGVGEIGEAGLTEAQAKNPKVRERANHLWHFMKTRSPFFTAWFGKSQVVDAVGEPMERLTDIGAVFVPRYGQFMSLTKLQRMAKDAGVPLPAYMPFAVARASDLAAMEKFIEKDLTPRMEGIVKDKQQRVAHLRELRFGLEAQLDQMMVLRAEQLSTVIEGEATESLVTSVAEMNAWTARYTAISRQLEARITSMKAEEDQLVKEIQAALDNPINYEDNRKPVAVYAKVENPLHVSTGPYYMLTSAQLSSFVYYALETKHDGLIMHEFPTGIGTRTTLVIPLRTEQLKWVKSLTFSSAPTIHWDWDQTDVHEMNAKDVVEKARAAAPRTKLRRFFIRYVDLLHAALQAQQIAQLNPDIVGAQQIIATGRKYQRDISTQLNLAQEAAKATSKLAKEMKKKLMDAMLAEVREQHIWLSRAPVAGAVSTSPALSQALVGSEAMRQAVTEHYVITELTLQKFRENGIDSETPEGKLAIEAYLQMKNSYFSQLQFLEWTLKQRILERVSDVGEQGRQWRLITDKFAPLKSTPFVPQMWFGDYVLVIKAKIEGKWRVVHKEAWEDPKDYLARTEALTKRLRSNERLEKQHVDDKQYVLMALPTEFLAEAARELNLTPQQLTTLEELAQPLKVDKAVARYSTSHLQISGASEDLERTFSAFSWHQANFIAKMRYRPHFRSHVAAIRAQARILERSSLMGPVERYTHVERYASVTREMSKALDYLMSPEQEMANFRAAISTLYLAFNVKTALINLYGLVTTFSDMTASLGNVRGTATFIKGFAYTVKSAVAGQFMTSPEQARVLKAVDKAVKEGVLSQSYAYMLAGQAIGGYWQRMFNRAFSKVDDVTGLTVASSMGRAGKWIMNDVGMAPFRMLELATRRATFVAKYLQGIQTLPAEPTGDLAPEDKAYDYAVRATEELQSDWSRLNRPRMFRGGGKLGALVPAGTIFLSFAQHMAFHAYGGYGAGQKKLARVEGKTPRSAFGGYTMRLWLITLLIAGLKGLPGFENLFDLLNWLWRHTTGRTFEQDVRKYTQDVAKMNIPILSMIAEDPSRVLYGISHDVWGFNLSQSVGFGRMVPGTDVLTRPTDNPAALLGGVFSSLMGPAGSTAYWLARWTLDPTYSNFAKLPGGIGSGLQAMDWSEHGARGPQGNRLTTDEKGAVRDVTRKEIVGRALGFRPTVISESQEKAFEAWDTKLYWQTRRNDVLELGRTAYLQNDREGIADFKKAIGEYNADTPEAYPELKITSKDISRTVIQRIKRVRALEKGIEPDKRYYRLERDVMSSFAKVPDVDEGELEE